MIMKQEDKELLLRDLCGRLPYGVYGNYLNSDGSLSDDELLRRVKIGYRDLICADGRDGMVLDGFLKPYLFPLSSMTEEQLYINPIGFSQMLTIKADRDWENITINRRAYYKLVDWFNKNHFDYRGLIPMGLAIDATGLNIYKEETK
jgi:hypothetical protein